jgi:hypothetical protein
MVYLLLDLLLVNYGIFGNCQQGYRIYFTVLWQILVVIIQLVYVNSGGRGLNLVVFEVSYGIMFIVQRVVYFRLFVERGLLLICPMVVLVGDDVVFGYLCFRGLVFGVIYFGNLLDFIIC